MDYDSECEDGYEDSPESMAIQAMESLQTNVMPAIYRSADAGEGDVADNDAKSNSDGGSGGSGSVGVGGGSEGEGSGEGGPSRKGSGEGNQGKGAADISTDPLDGSTDALVGSGTDVIVCTSDTRARVVLLLARELSLPYCPFQVI